jgi:hypothetical protein
MRDLIGGRRRGRVNAELGVRRWAREAFGLDPSATLLVTELRCSKPGCPPHETVIAIFERGEPPREHRLPKPVTQIARSDVCRLASESGSMPPDDEAPPDEETTT